MLTATPARAGSSPTTQHPDPSLMDSRSQEPENLYDVLGVEPGVSAAQLRAAWLRVLVRAHPDKGGCPSAFRRLQAAWATLSDPAERLLYDEKLAGLSSGAGSSSSSIGQAPRVLRPQPGICAIVHGQTRPAEPPQQQFKRQGDSVTSSSAAAELVADPLAAVSAELARLQRQRDVPCSIGSRGRSWPAEDLSTQLAALYLRRAQLQQEHGRLHHALFDCGEALTANPGCTLAATLAEELLQAVKGKGAERVAKGSSSSSSESDDEPATEIGTVTALPL